MDFKNLLTRSTMPFAHGAATATFLCLILLLAQKSVNSLEANPVLLSVTISDGVPKTSITFSICLIVSFEPVDLTANNQVKRVNASTKTNIFLYLSQIS